jgi:hypothetical protein
MMCAPGTNQHRAWKSLFLFAEALALLGCSYALAYFFSYRFYSQNHVPWATNHISVRIIRFCEQWLTPMLWSFLAALFILLLVSPFFTRSSLRSIAVKAWIIGVLALVFVGFIVWKIMRF